MERPSMASGGMTLLSMHAPTSRLVARLEDSAGSLRSSSPESKACLQDLFQQLDEESGLGTLESSIMAQSLLRILLIRLQRLYPRRWESPSPTAGQRLTEDYCRLVGTDFLERRRVADYATLLGVSADHLSATFRKTTGLPPGILIQNHLVLEAKRLLAHSTLTIGEVAERLKFKDSSSFSRFFRRATGVAPTEFRTEAASRISP